MEKGLFFAAEKKAKRAAAGDICLCILAAILTVWVKPVFDRMMGKEQRGIRLRDGGGSGGILCPIRYDGEKILLEDVIKTLNLSCLLVADAGLGTINSVVLTAEYMRARNIPIVGMIFNRFHPGNVMEEDNIRMCQELTGLKTLACVREGDRELRMDAEALKSLYRFEPDHL